MSDKLEDWVFGVGSSVSKLSTIIGLTITDAAIGTGPTGNKLIAVRFGDGSTWEVEERVYNTGLNTQHHRNHDR